MDEQQCVWKCDWTFRLEQQWTKVKSLSEGWLLAAFLGGQWCSILLSVFIDNLGPRMKSAFWKFVAATKLGEQSVCWDKCLQFRGFWSGWRNGLSVTSWRSVKAKKQRLSLRLKQPHSTVQAGGHMGRKKVCRRDLGVLLDHESGVGSHSDQVQFYTRLLLQESSWEFRGSDNCSVFCTYKTARGVLSLILGSQVWKRKINMLEWFQQRPWIWSKG